MYYDYVYWIVLGISFIITVIAQVNVSSTFSKYSKIQSKNGYSGMRVADHILSQQGINNVSITHISGSLTDNYNPSNYTVNLSDPVYGQTTIAAASVAAHECGHACQHATGYGPLKARHAIYPVVSFASKFSWILIFLGIIMYSRIGGFFLDLGIIFFSATVVFQLVTLPVEFNASNRALRILENDSILTEEEMKGAKKVLTAAALTYVASLAVSILQLIRLILMARSRER